MANFLNLQQRLAARGRLDLTQANFKTLAQQFLNEAGKEIWEVRDWFFTVDRQVVQTVLDVTVGTVAISGGSTTVTGTGTAFTSSMIGFYLQVSTSNDWYKITAVASTTSLTIEVPYVSTTNSTGLTYTIRKFFYSLSSTTDKILDARQTISPSFIDVVNYRDFDIFRPYPLATADGPRYMVVFGFDSSGNLRFTPYPWPSQVANIEIRYKNKYVDMVNDTDTTLIPDKWNETVMIQGALYRVCQLQDDGSNPTLHERYKQAKIDFEMMLMKMIAAEQPDASYHPIIQNRDILDTPIGPLLPFKYGVS